jgi:signal transduction histidine kinase
MPDPIHILIVDDEARNLDALEAILQDPAYRILRADDADKALRLLLENQVAAIVLDIKMPGVSGFELARLIKGTKKFRQIPLVFLTAYLVNDADVVAGYGAGAVDYLTKPVNPQILRHKVAVFAELFRKTRALAELNEHLETRVQERTAELERSETALRAADRQKDLFLATLAHELRNPLAPLRTGLDLLLQELQQSPLAVRTLSVMNRQLDHMVRLVEDLLDVSRISGGRLEMRKDHVDLLSIIERALETVQPALTKRGQQVTVDAPLPVPAHVDATRIAQIIANLLSNASKHSPPGAEIRIELEVEGDLAVLRVVDRGAGIPTDQLGRVFDTFTKIERREGVANDGLGIGLALSRQLAELHGGSLVVASAGEGRGATFTLQVPTGNARRASDSPATTDAPALRASRGLRVVLVEDNEDSAEMLSTWLEHLGHDVHVAHAGDEGLALVLQERPDVVLCDLGLPGMDGVEVCRRILRATSTPPTMVALTGWGMAEDRRRTGEAGFRHHLVKPIALEKLRTLLAGIDRGE